MGDRMDEDTSSSSQQAFLSRMALNVNKAGMEGLDKKKINKIILETSKGSRYYENELKKDKQVNQRIERMLQQKAEITEQQLRKAQAQVEKTMAELERCRDLSRVVVHVDMDAFYAAVEMRDCPELKGKPMAVGSMSMLSTSNYHARKFGVRAAMPGFIGKKLCPQLVIVPLNFDKYKAVSREVRQIFADYDPNFLPMSLDEAYLDITEHLVRRQSWPQAKRTLYLHSHGLIEGQEPTEVLRQQDRGDLSPVLFEDSPTEAVEHAVVFGTSADEAVREMRFRIEQKTGLTASAGISPNTMLSKVCSDKNKPNGQYRIPAERQAVVDFVQDLPIRKVPGIGKVTEKMLSALGINTCSELHQRAALLTQLFSQTSWYFFLQISLGLGSTRVERDGERKSISTERTFGEMSSAEEQYSLCRELCRDLAQDLQKEGLKGRTVTVKLKNVNFEVKTKALTLCSVVSTEEDIFMAAKDLLAAEIDHVSPLPLRLRLMGVRVSGFPNADDKQHQKSIIGFLQSGRAGATKTSQKALVVPTPVLAGLPEVLQEAAEESTASCGKPQSFFERMRLQRLQVQPEAPENRDVTGAPSTEGFVCPVCFQEQRGTDLRSFNRHVDDCLRRVSAEREPSTSSKAGGCVGPSTALPSGHEEVRTQTALDKSHRSTPSPDLIPFRNVDRISNEHASAPVELTFDTSGAHVEDEASAEVEPTFLTCPVCNTRQDTGDLALFNRHVDVCLNQRVLWEFGEASNDIPSCTGLKGQTPGHLRASDQRGKSKRQRSSPPPALQKRTKAASSTKTIDQFFR